MSRWTDDKKRFSKHGHDIWVGCQKHYIVTTDQATFYVDRYNLDYKKTIQNLKNAGYTNINITCLGFNTTWKTLQ